MAEEKDIKYKMVFIYIIMILLAIGIIGRILNLQSTPKEVWESMMQTVQKEKIKPFRGDICACDGSILATSMPSYSIHWDLTVSGITDTAFNNNIDSLSKCLSKLFEDYSPEEYAQRFKKARKEKKQYCEVHKKVTHSELNILKKFPLFKGSRYKTGLITQQEYNREQITDLLSTRTIGKFKKDSPLTGIEGAFNEELSGKEGYLVLKKISSGERAVIESSDEENTTEPEDGSNIITTLDYNIQDFAERALEKQLIKYNATYGTVILMEVKTGKIRALCNLEKNSDGNYTEQMNRGVGTKMDPGSTFKLATMIAILETGKYDLDDTIDTKKGILNLKGATIKDDHEGGLGKITVRQIFEKSSNVGFATMTEKVFGNNPENFINYLYNMHLNKKTGIEIHGEPQPYIKYPGDADWWSGTYLYNSYGYELELTPLQLLTFYNAVANEGVMVKPHLLECVMSHGKITRKGETEILNSSICSKETLNKVQELLIGVVKNGTAKQIYTEKYPIAGKTGTAQIYIQGQKKYEKEDGTKDHRASFAGYFPADKPKYSCIVVISDPKEHSYYGSSVAAPVFKTIADKIYTIDYDLQHQKEFNISKFKNSQTIPISKNGDRIILDRILSKLRIELDNVEFSETPLVSTTRNKNKIRIDPLPSPPGVVPNVVGMGLRDAMYELKNKKLDVTVIGRGTVKKQSITPGSKIPQNNKIIIELGS
ncbi:MAG: transpeptidase family protein [Bacteroidales bacterium]|nr:transpeptidase family protein [Bacteroidales bacterium]